MSEVIKRGNKPWVSSVITCAECHCVFKITNEDFVCRSYRREGYHQINCPTCDETIVFSAKNQKEEAKPNNLYVEISPRGSGKTWRLREAARKYLQDNPTENVFICSSSIRGTDWILKGFEEEFRSRIITSMAMENDCSRLGIRGFYDDFLLNASLETVNPNGYYASSAVSTNLLGLKNTFFGRLLAANNYQYTTTMPLMDIDKRHLRSAWKDAVNYNNVEAFEVEYLNNFWKIK